MRSSEMRICATLQSFGMVKGLYRTMVDSTKQDLTRERVEGYWADGGDFVIMCICSSSLKQDLSFPVVILS